MLDLHILMSWKNSDYYELIHELTSPVSKFINKCANLFGTLYVYGPGDVCAVPYTLINLFNFVGFFWGGRDMVWLMTIIQSM